MRGLLVMLLVSCTISRGGPDELDDSPTPGGCRSDSGCSGGNVCARTGVCLPPSQVRAAHVMWVVNGKTADSITCSPHPDLRLDIHAATGGAPLGYTPVPCSAGKFSIDKLPTTFDRVDLGPTHDSDGWRSGTLDASGELTLDLPF